MNKREEFLAECVVVDTETTGKDFNTAQIIESAFVIREDNDWTIFQELHKPLTGKVPPEISAMCYITNKMVEDKPPFIESKDVFQSVMDGYHGGYIIAHNYFYDMKVLQNHGVTLPANSICTWKLSKKLFSESADIKETNLPYLRFALELDVPLDLYAHRAGADTYATGKLLEKLIDIMEEEGIIDPSLPYGPQIKEYEDAIQIYKTMPFGKHKGVPMAEIPSSYWNWALKSTNWFDDTSDNYDPSLAASIAAVLGD